eukprot:TRINITY_DN20137_c0_g1_i2.p1 TRINITY_DN20137_c0_g1~~TRINITY_DN20137_c0_g1_i2.p1  ORF type:complete len:592 (+),score=140.50 TRINITY_DN20137_c0_g1_i2:52-1776(+)
MTDKIKVYVRLRPVDEESSQEGDSYDKLFKWSDHRLCPLQGKEASRGKDGYLFQRVFSPESTNRDVFDEVREVVSNGLDGISGTVLAYGQTATGKTHTMQGSDSDAGISARLIKHLFQEASNRSDWTYTMTVGFFEIYNEHVYDLLTTDATELELRCDTLVGLQSTDCATADDATALLTTGQVNRKQAATDLNERSSRSHTVFRIQVTGIGSNGKKRSSQIHLVDLAGSECAKTAGTSEATLREGSAINKSLLSLIHVIKQLADKASHINYRDSKLTRILSNSLGGNAKTYLICCITACQKFFSGTMSTIHFADRARVVYNTVKVNEADGRMLISYDDHMRLMAMYEEDITAAQQRELAMEDIIHQEVKAALSIASADAVAETKLFEELDLVSQEKISALEKQKSASEKETVRLEKEVHKLQKKVDDSEKAIDRTKGIKADTEEKLRDLRKQLKEKDATIREKNKQLSSKDTEARYDDLADKYADLEKEKDNLGELLSERESKITELEKDVSSLKKTSASASEENIIKRAKIVSMCGESGPVTTLLDDIREVHSAFLKEPKKQSKKNTEAPSAI